MVQRILAGNTTFPRGIIAEGACISTFYPTLQGSDQRPRPRVSFLGLTNSYGTGTMYHIFCHKAVEEVFLSFFLIYFSSLKYTSTASWPPCHLPCVLESDLSESLCIIRFLVVGEPGLAYCPVPRPLARPVIRPVSCRERFLCLEIIFQIILYAVFPACSYLIAGFNIVTMQY